MIFTWTETHIKILHPDKAIKYIDERTTDSTFSDFHELFGLIYESIGVAADDYDVPENIFKSMVTAVIEACEKYFEKWPNNFKDKYLRGELE